MARAYHASVPGRTPLRDLHLSLVRDEAERRRRAVAQAGRAPGAMAALPELEWVPWGPAAPDGGPACELVATYGAPEAEYAAIRRGAGVMDRPHRGTLLVTGAERVAFLQRMLTQDVAPLGRGPASCEAFRLNRKGRIEADILVIECGDRTLLDVDLHAAAPLAASLERSIFADDVQVADVTEAWCRIGVHGPAAAALLESSGIAGAVVAPEFAVLAGRIAGVEATCVRRDECAAPGFELLLPAEGADAVFRTLVAPQPALAVRAIGWLAYNTARIEGGTPLFQVDFGPDSLPHETSLLGRRVNFRKGCYLGQEVVARMESLGKPKQVVAAIRMREDLLPVAGTQLFETGAEGSIGPPAGVVTSSAPSPMLGGACIGFATVRTAHATPGATLITTAEGTRGTAEVQPSLRFLPAVGAPS